MPPLRSLCLLCLALLPGSLAAQSTRPLHQPDISARFITFAYAGDIWLAPRRPGSKKIRTSRQTESGSPLRVSMAAMKMSTSWRSTAEHRDG